MRRIIPLFALCLVIPSACDYIPETDYSSFADIPESGMPQNWEYDFPATEKDSSSVITGRHDVVIVVRYTDECPSSSILLNIEELSLAHEVPDSTTVRVQLFSDKGKPLGNGVYGIFETTDTIHHNVVIPDGYTLSVSSPHRQEETKGIKSVGLVLPRR